MRNKGTILNVPGASARKKKVFAFKTISFLVSNPENEPGDGFSDHPIGDEGDRTYVTRPLRPIL